MVSPQELENANTRAIMLKDQGDYMGARDYLHHALHHARRVLGEENPTTLSIMFNLSALLQLTGCVDEALPLAYEVLRIRREEFGEDHPDTIKCMINLGTLLESQGNFEEALKERHVVLEARRRAHGPEHADTLAAMSALAATLLRAERIEEALPVLAEEMAGHIQRHGAACASKLPQDTLACGRLASDQLAAMDDGGAHLPGYAAYVRVWQVALSPKAAGPALGKGAQPAANPTAGEEQMQQPVVERPAALDAWTSAHVQQWLRECGVGDAAVLERVLEEEVDGEAFGIITKLRDRETLRALGLGDEHFQRRLFEEWAYLQSAPIQAHADALGGADSAPTDAAQATAHEEPGPAPDILTVADVLREAGASKFASVAEGTSLGAWGSLLDYSGRPAFLQMLKDLGVDQLRDRQAVANTFGRLRRDRRVAL